MSASLEDELLARIARDGPLPFAAFMSLALYHPRFGYYASGAARTGWRGHFLTSPELDPAFGALWARGLRSIWELCGQPERFDVIEVGPGEGTFAAAILASVDDDFRRTVRYRMVERIPEVEARQRERTAAFVGVEWSRSLTEVEPVTHACVVANEVLDNLPVHIVQVVDGHLVEVCVGSRDGRLGFVVRPPSNPELGRYLERCGVTPAEGYRFEVGLAAEAFVARAARVIGTGALVAVDYGADADRLAARPGGSLMTYSAAGTDDRVLDDVGHKDITAHVNWTAVAAAARAAGLSVWGPRPQRDVLRALGAPELDARLKRDHDDAIAAGRGADAVRALSRRHALGALVDPGGLGRLDVMVAARGISAPGFMGP